MIECPDCKGAGEYEAHVNYGGPDGEWKVVDCSRCKGTGEVADEQAEWMIKGKMRRLERVSRGVSLYDEANRLGISSADLSAMETGRADPTVEPSR